MRAGRGRRLGPYPRNCTPRIPRKCGSPVSTVASSLLAKASTMASVMAKSRIRFLCCAWRAPAARAASASKGRTWDHERMTCHATAGSFPVRIALLVTSATTGVGVHDAWAASRNRSTAAPVADPSRYSTQAYESTMYRVMRGPPDPLRRTSRSPAAAGGVHLGFCYVVLLINSFYLFFIVSGRGWGEGREGGGAPPGETEVRI